MSSGCLCIGIKKHGWRCSPSRSKSNSSTLFIASRPPSPSLRESLQVALLDYGCPSTGAEQLSLVRARSEAHGLSDEAIVHRVMCKALGPKRRQSKQKCPGQLSWGIYERSVRKLGLNPRPPC